MNFVDILWLETLFEKLLNDAKKARTKEDIIILIRRHYLVFKEKKIEMVSEITV